MEKAKNRFTSEAVKLARAHRKLRPATDRRQKFLATCGTSTMNHSPVLTRPRILAATQTLGHRLPSQFCSKAGLTSGPGTAALWLLIASNCETSIS